MAPGVDVAPPILILPGLFDSGPGHWQTLFEEKLPGAGRVVQRDWAAPEPGEWVEALDREIRRCAEAPVIVAHSLGCITAVRWAESPRGDVPVRGALVAPVRGALLVAPSDVDRADAPAAIRVFRPVPLRRLPFPSIVVCSSDDPFLAVERGREFAQAWGSRLVEIGAAGHVNAASGFGPWPRGESLVRSLLE